MSKALLSCPLLSSPLHSSPFHSSLSSRFLSFPTGPFSPLPSPLTSTPSRLLSFPPIPSSPLPCLASGPLARLDSPPCHTALSMQAASDGCLSFITSFFSWTRQDFTRETDKSKAVWTSTGKPKIHFVVGWMPCCAYCSAVKDTCSPWKQQLAGLISEKNRNGDMYLQIFSHGMFVHPITCVCAFSVYECAFVYACVCLFMPEYLYMTVFVFVISGLDWQQFFRVFC